MGTSISKLRKDVALLPDHDEKHAMHERLKILEKVILYQLDNAKLSILKGETGNQEIYAGPVSAVTKQVNIIMAGRPPDEVRKSVKQLFRGHVKKLVLKAVSFVVTNPCVGEHEGTSTFIQWTEHHCAIMRLDIYCYRWNFSSDKVIHDLEGAVGVIIVKRLINLANIDSQILTSTMFKQLAFLNNPRKITRMLKKADKTLQRLITIAKELEDTISTVYMQQLCSNCLICRNSLNSYTNLLQKHTKQTKRIKRRKYKSKRRKPYKKQKRNKPKSKHKNR